MKITINNKSKYVEFGCLKVGATFIGLANEVHIKTGEHESIFFNVERSVWDIEKMWDEEDEVVTVETELLVK